MPAGFTGGCRARFEPKGCDRTARTTAAITDGLVVVGGGRSFTMLGLIKTRLPLSSSRSIPPIMSSPARSIAAGSCPCTIATSAFPSRVKGLGGRGLAGTSSPSGSNSRLPMSERGAMAIAGRNVSPNPRRLSKSRRETATALRAAPLLERIACLTPGPDAALH